MNAINGLVLAVFVGMLLPLQALIDAALGRRDLGGFAALMSFAVGTVVLSVSSLVSRPRSKPPHWPGCRRRRRPAV